MSKGRFERYLVLAQRFGARTQMFQEAAARRLALTATELACFRLIQLHGPLTASDLVRETGLRGASLSVVVDRLVGEGFLTREQDQADRRRWLLRVEPSAVARLQPVYAAHARRVDALLDEYDEAGFETVLRFLDRFAEELRLTAVRLNDGEDGGD